ncbi:heme A synthase [Vibrio sp. NTOU-M3]|uniref:COX15/CtaA family protein n=1 Tax=Vibrio sp. NTOU-M3 TaxID=3234954 RepID=UPI00349F6406
MKLKNLVRVALILTFIVIMLGAYTRLADAGLGCPDWPGCYGQLTVPVQQHELERASSLYPDLKVEADKAWLEMIHRYFAGTLGLVVFAITALSIKSRAVPSFLPISISLVVVFQALLGMWTVTMKLMPVIVMGHLLGGFTLFALLALLYWRLTHAQDQIDHLTIPPMLRLLALTSLLFLLVQIALGGWTSSNYAALMCTSLPLCEGDWRSHLDFVNAFTLIQPERETYEFGTLDYGARMTIHVVHRIGALVVAVSTLCLIYQMLAESDSVLNRLAWRVFSLLCLQIGLGISNVVLSLPLAVAVAHNLGAALLMLSLLYVNFLLWYPSESVVLNKERVHE